MRIYVISLIAFLLSNLWEHQAHASTISLFEDPEGIKLTDEIITDVFNYKFDVAKHKIKTLENKGYQNHPAPPFLEALILYNSILFEIDSKKIGAEFEVLLDKVIIRAKKMIDDGEYPIEGTYFALYGNAYLAYYYSENSQLTKAVGVAKHAYTHLKEGFHYKDENAEFLLSTGLYNFYREQYPITRPITKPFMSFFPPGNKATGIRYIKEAFDKCTFGKPVAIQYLNHVHLKYEEEYELALEYAETMTSMYPGNDYFKAKYAETLLFLEKYDKAKPVINELKNSETEYFEMIGLTLNGIYYELYKNNFKIARNNYRLAKEIGLKNTDLTYDHLGMCYFGFARMLEKEEKTSLAKDYYKKALQYSEYPFIIRASKTYIRSN